MVLADSQNLLLDLIGGLGRTCFGSPRSIRKALYSFDQIAFNPFVAGLSTDTKTNTESRKIATFSHSQRYKFFPQRHKANLFPWHIPSPFVKDMPLITVTHVSEQVLPISPVYTPFKKGGRKSPPLFYPPYFWRV
jgi:hypothetical protein